MPDVQSTWRSASITHRDSNGTQPSLLPRADEYVVEAEFELPSTTMSGRSPREQLQGVTRLEGPEPSAVRRRGHETLTIGVLRQRVLSLQQMLRRAREGPPLGGAARERRGTVESATSDETSVIRSGPAGQPLRGSLDIRFAAHAAQPQLEPPGAGYERTVLRRQSGQDMHCGIVDVDDFREIEDGHAAVHGIEEHLDGVAGQRPNDACSPGRARVLGDHDPRT
jgi:hypothetical protein